MTGILKRLVCLRSWEHRGWGPAKLHRRSACQDYIPVRDGTHSCDDLSVIRWVFHWLRCRSMSNPNSRLDVKCPARRGVTNFLQISQTEQFEVLLKCSSVGD